MSNKWAACQDKLLWRWRDDWGGLLPTSREEEMGGLWVCLLPGNEAVSKVHNLFMFQSSRFCPSDRFKAAFPEALSWKPEGRPNLILRSSNIPQSNITRLRSYHIQRERAIFFHHSSLLSLFQSSTNAGPFFSSSPKASLSYWTEWKDFSQVLTLSFTTRPVAHLKASCGGNSSSTPSVI